MKRTSIAIAIVCICIPVSSFAADPRCAMGLFMLCQQTAVTPVTNHAGSRPATTTTAPTQVGGIVPDIHNTALVSTQHSPTPANFQLTPQELAWAQAHFGQGASSGGQTPVPQLPTLDQLFPAHTPLPSFQLTPQEIAWAQAHFGQGANQGTSIPQPPKPVPIQTPPVQVPPPIPQTQILQGPHYVDGPLMQQQLIQPTLMQPQVPTVQAEPPKPVAIQSQLVVVSQPPAQQVAIPYAQANKPVVVMAQPQLPTTTYNPPQPLATVQSPVTNQVQPLAQPPQPGGQGQPQPYHPHALLTHAPDSVRATSSGRFDGPASIYNLEFIEPGLQHRKVKVYRTNDAAEQIYRDTIPLDKGGFQIIVIGTRNPEYVH